MSKKFRFEACYCHHPAPHGYFYNDHKGWVKIAIISVAAGRYLMSRLKDFEGENIAELERSMATEGLPQTAENDLKSVDAQLYARLHDSASDVLDQFFSQAIEVGQRKARVDSLRRQAEMN